MGRDPDPRVALSRVANAFHGAFALEHALAAGFTRRQMKHRLEVREWERLHRGIYRFAAWPADEYQAAVAAWLACGQGAFISHRSAAAFWGLTAHPQRPDVTVPHDRHPTVSGVDVHRTRRHRGGYVGTKAGIALSTPAATLVDISGVVAAAILEAALDDAVRRNLTTLDRVHRMLAGPENARKPGTAELRELVRVRVRVTDSYLESELFRILRYFRLPLPELQYPVMTRNGMRFIDFAYVDEMVALEPDGYDSHTQLRQFEDDRIKGPDLRELGWNVVPFTWIAITRRPDEVAMRVARALGLTPARWRKAR